MSRIVDFYRAETLHPNGVSIDTIWGWNDRQLEVSHTYIQWLFPLREPSRAVPGSPTITEAERRLFRNDPGLRERVLRSFRLMLGFYPLSITRILRSMVLLGLKREAVEWFAALQRVYVASADLIGRTTYEYWHDAVEGRYRP